MPLSFARNDLGDSNFSGCEVADIKNGDIKTALEKATRIGFDFIACSLDGDDAFYRRNRRRRRRSGEASRSSSEEDDGDFVQRPCDFQLTAESWSSRVVAVSAFGCPGDYYEHFKGGKDENDKHGTCENMCRKLEEDLSYASHLNLHAVIIRTYRPRFDDDVRSAFETFDEAVSSREENDIEKVRGDMNSFREHALMKCARVVNAHFEDSMVNSTRVWLEFDSVDDDSYAIWQKFRAACHGHENLGICIRNAGVYEPVLEKSSAANHLNGLDFEGARRDKERDVANVTGLLGKMCAYEMVPRDDASWDYSKWFAEPVKCVCVDTFCFTPNKHAYPVLPKRMQEFLSECFKRDIQVILASGDEYVKNPNVDKDTPLEDIQFHESTRGTHTTQSSLEWSTEYHPMKEYFRYIAHLFENVPPLSEQEVIERDYRDKVQAPLQPLADNLESATYEVFEKDDSKYDAYEDAIELALLDIKDTVSDIIRVAVVGAGRGPLVKATINAAVKASVSNRLKVYVVEKNPNAVHTLRHRAQSENWAAVNAEIFHSDGRIWEAPEKCDVLVSELLGSFGDNELSPECLDGAQRCLKPETGISIPQEYTSYLAPMTGAAVHQACSSTVSRDLDLKAKETPHVVKLYRHHLLDEAREVFTFKHPRRISSKEKTGKAYSRNERHAVITFTLKDKCATLHGFAGYFDALLYKSSRAKKSVNCSIHLPTHTRNKDTNELMFSWFPIFFPIDVPIDMRSKDPQFPNEIILRVWRCVSSSAVWYEWQCECGGQSTRVFNAKGRSSKVGLY